MNNRFKLRRCALSVLIIVLVGCERAKVPSPLERGLLTGECLNSDVLKTALRIESNSFNFAFVLDVDSCTESWGDLRYRRIPSSTVFKEFGDHSSTIQNEFDRLFEDFDHNQSVYFGLLFASTIFYDGGMSLFADKEFAGHSAGEDLIPYCRVNEQGIYSKNNPKNTVYLPLLDNYSFNFIIPYDTMTPYLSFPCGDYKVVDENVTFTLKIPVKVGYYLTWIDNRITNPEAEMPYEERILTGTFNIGKGLQ